METSSPGKTFEQWLVELNDPQAEHRREALTALVDSGTLDDRLINELKLIARGDPDSKAQFLAKKVLKSRGIKIFPQISDQPGVKPTGLLWSSEFWIGFFLCPILNYILFSGLQFFALIANKTTSIFLVNVVLLIYFGFTRKNVALGMLAAFVFFIVILPICLVIYLSWSCWPDGCPVPQ